MSRPRGDCVESAAVLSDRIRGGPRREADLADVGTEPQPEAGADGCHEHWATFRKVMQTPPIRYAVPSMPVKVW